MLMRYICYAKYEHDYQRMMSLNSELIPYIKQQLLQPLPGEDAQYRMAPSYRPRLTHEQVMVNNPRISAVMVLLYEKDGALHLVFTLRHQYDGVHSGQMSFPGGKRDEEDKDLTETALRETWEEVGVTADKIEVLGRLSELYIPPSNFLVYPTVGYAKEVQVFAPQEEEVDEIVQIPLSFFLDNKNINLQTEIKVYNGQVVRVPAYVLGKYIIWGATAIMLSEFTYVVEKALANRA